MMDQAATRAVEEFVHAAIRSTRRRCCWSKPTARRRKWPPRWRRSGACSPRPARPRFACRRTRRAPAVLVGPQGGVSGDRPHLAGLLLHRRHDSARALPQVLRADRGAVGAVRAALRQRVPRRRRQPASAHPVRRQRRRRDRAHRGVRRRDPRAVHRGRRHDHRRARRRRREAAADVRAVPPGASSSAFSRSRRRSIRTAAQSRQGRAHAARAAPSSARCTSITASLPHPELPRF